MKNMHLCAAILCIAAVFIGSQWVYGGSLAGTREVSVSGQMGRVTRSVEDKYRTPWGSWTSKSETESTFMTLALRYGVFIYRGLEFEPEIHWTSLEDIKPALSLHGNLAYNFNVPQSQDKPRVMPFVLAGYGIGNAVPFSLSLCAPSSDSWNIGVLNLGAGLKAFVTENAALRVEYRYQRYAWSEEYGYSKTENTEAFHNIFFGFSVFLPPRGEQQSKP